MTSCFRVIEHVIPCQHIREYPHATATEQEEVLNLAVKQYIPLDNPNPQPGDVTLIGAHANGFPKVSRLTGSDPIYVSIRVLLDHRIVLTSFQ